MSERIDKKTLAELLSKNSDLSIEQCHDFFDVFVPEVLSILKQQDNVHIRNLGIFKIVEQDIPFHKNGQNTLDNRGYKINFYPDKSLENSVNKPFSNFETTMLDDDVVFDSIETVVNGEVVNENEDNKDSKQNITFGKTSGLSSDSVNIGKAITESKFIIEENMANKDLTPHDGADSNNEKETSKTNDALNQSTNAASANGQSSTSTVEDKNVNPEAGSKANANNKQPEHTAKSHKQHPVKKARKSHTGLYVTLIIIVILIIVFGYFFIEGKCPITMSSRTDKQVINVQVVADSTQLTSEDKDTTSFKTAADARDWNAKTVYPVRRVHHYRHHRRAFKGTGVLAKITMEEGQTLRNIALKYYDNKVFWVYIYKENKEAIGDNPNHVKVGTTLVIPKASKYGINAHNINSLKKAKKEENKLYSMFWF